MPEETIWYEKTYECPECKEQIKRVHLSETILCSKCGLWFDNPEYMEIYEKFIK